MLCKQQMAVFVLNDSSSDSLQFIDKFNGIVVTIDRKNVLVWNEGSSQIIASNKTMKSKCEDDFLQVKEWFTNNKWLFLFLLIVRFFKWFFYCFKSNGYIILHRIRRIGNLNQLSEFDRSSSSRNHGTTMQVTSVKNFS